MKDALIELKNGYTKKLNAYIDAARVLEPFNEELMMECLKKAAGCKLMIEESNYHAGCSMCDELREKITALESSLEQSEQKVSDEDIRIEVENFAEFLAKGEIDLTDGDYYWSDDKDGNYPMDHKQVVGVWINFENQPDKELDELDDILLDNKEYD